MLKFVLAITVLLVCTLGFVIAGCSTESTQNANVDVPAPDFQFNDAEGQSTSLYELRGKPVLINFWQTTCPPCVYEMPYLQQVYDEWLDKGLVVLAINVGESSSRVGGFMQSHGLSLPVVLDTNGVIAQKYNIRYFPTTFFVDTNSMVNEMKIGAFFNKAEIEESLNKIMP